MLEGGPAARRLLGPGDRSNSCLDIFTVFGVTVELTIDVPLAPLSTAALNDGSEGRGGLQYTPVHRVYYRALRGRRMGLIDVYIR